MSPHPTLSLHYAARTNPELYRPLIDQALLSIALFCEAPLLEARTALQALQTTPTGRRAMGPWEYLFQGLHALRGYLCVDSLREVLGCSWFVYLISEEWEAYEGHILVPDASLLGLHQELGAEPVFLETYPEESWEFLFQETYVGGYGADVLGLWKRDGGYTSLCHAHPEGFWVVAHDPVDFVERVVHSLTTDLHMRSHKGTALELYKLSA